MSTYAIDRLLTRRLIASHVAEGRTLFALTERGRVELTVPDQRTA